MNFRMFKQKTYDRLKWLVQIFLPAMGALYFGIAQLWGLPAAEEVVGTFAVLAIFFGALITKSSQIYHEEVRLSGGSMAGIIDLDATHGTMVVKAEDDRTIFELEDLGDPDDLMTKDRIIFTVRHE